MFLICWLCVVVFGCVLLVSPVYGSNIQLSFAHRSNEPERKWVIQLNKIEEIALLVEEIFRRCSWAYLGHNRGVGAIQ